MGDFVTQLRTLAGRAALHAEAPPPAPPGRALCDRPGTRMTVPSLDAAGRVLLDGRLTLVVAEGREVTCWQCLRIQRWRQRAEDAR